MTKAEYLQLRDQYVPENIKIIFVLESPPASGLYFYNPQGSVAEPLFRAMMKDVLELTPASKEEGLSKFREQGYFLIDSTYTPVNHLPDRKKEAIILRDFPLLLKDLRDHAAPVTGIVLVKANVCRLLESKLKEEGFNVLNQEIKIPFPGTGQQSNFRDKIHKVLGINN